MPSVIWNIFQYKKYIFLFLATVFLSNVYIFHFYTFNINSLWLSLRIKSSSSKWLRTLHGLNIFSKGENTKPPKEFKSANIFYRPKKLDPEAPYDFDDAIEYRVFKQRNWMANLTKTKLFHTLKPKRVFVEKNYAKWYGFGTERCGSVSKYWKPKCKFELEKNVTSDTKFSDNIEDFDAVITFRQWISITNQNRKLPEGSSVKQIIAITEPPPKTGKVDLSLNNAFLASYFRGSDILMPLIQWIPHRINPNKNTRKNANVSKNYAEGRTKLATIVTSNCRPKNDRLKYIKELQRYIPVDIYGKCGTLGKCNRQCFKNLKTEYKFYLAFESANCRDYITEKLWRNALLHDMVPVVFGAHKKDYLSAAPPNSFIHVEDFETPEKLAEFLMKLDKNDDLYNKYFEWKDKGQLHHGLYYDFYCRACALLFIADFIKPPVWPPGSTWENVNVCLPKERRYWNRPN